MILSFRSSLSVGCLLRFCDKFRPTQQFATMSSATNGVGAKDGHCKSAIIMCGPSGSGKSTLVNRLMAEFPDSFGFSVSHTTRQPRPGEQDGKHYHFVDKSTMQTMIGNKEFMEWAEFSHNMYGTSKSEIDRLYDEGRICLLDIDMQGVRQCKEANLDAFYMFIRPPSMDSLEIRLRQRNTEDEKHLQKRLSIAAAEMKAAEETESLFDCVVVNDDIDVAYGEVRANLLPLVEGQKMRTGRTDG